jgi:hypothetical protein
MVKALLLFVVLVVGVVGFGFYNYNRNAGIEADLHKPRPYAQYSTADIAKLVAAYQADVKQSKARVASAPSGSSAIDRKDSSDVEGKADAFAGFQRENERWKEQRGHVMEQESELQKLLFEKSIRDRHLDDPVFVFKARLLTF